MPTLESRVRVKAAQMYRYLHEEIEALKEGIIPEGPEYFAKSVILDDFDTVRRAAEDLHLQPYDIHLSSINPPVYFFGAPLDDGDTDVTTVVLHNAFNRHGIFRDVLFNDRNHMLPRFGKTSDAIPYPAHDLRVESYLSRLNYGSIINPDSAQFTKFSREEKLKMIDQIIQFTHMLSGFEYALLRYLKQSPIERGYHYVKETVSYVIDAPSLVEDDRKLYADLHALVADNLDDPKNISYKVHNLVSPHLQNAGEYGQQVYEVMIALLPGKLTKLRDRRFAFVLQLQEALSPDMARFKKKIPKDEWSKHRSLVPNLAGLLREANINYAIFVPKADAVWQYPDPVLSLL